MYYRRVKMMRLPRNGRREQNRIETMITCAPTKRCQIILSKSVILRHIKKKRKVYEVSSLIHPQLQTHFFLKISIKFKNVSPSRDGPSNQNVARKISFKLLKHFQTSFSFYTESCISA